MCPYDLSQIHCEVNQYPIVAGHHDVNQPPPDGTCGAIAGLQVPLPPQDPIYDHSNYVSVSHQDELDWVQT